MKLDNKTTPDLCLHSGLDAEEMLFNKLVNPSGALMVGGLAIGRIVGFEASGKITSVSFTDMEDTIHSFSYLATDDPFRNASRSSAGEPMCENS